MTENRDAWRKYVYSVGEKEGWGMGELE